jgi:hypothetical protein
MSKNQNFRIDLKRLKIVTLRCSFNEKPDIVLQTFRGSAAGQ